MGQIRENIAKNIRAFRKAQGLSTDQVGEAMGKSGKTISAWERGQGQPDADELIALCIFFDVAITDLLTPENKWNTALSDGERTLLHTYRNMNEEGRSRLIEEASIMDRSGLFAKESVGEESDEEDPS